ncbi:Extracellular phospholipase A1 precursor [Mycobacteroides abscessus subsp. abscessus]|uniref:hypothetical protein n=1 Tax=Mycobacteroides abscessus TaxID=36809 RepID=UPI000929FD68|nr:hypothetical protein [Mycobacteroides abscessus]SHT00455.1 Extracellular phospholipase A1 precursor [Mycobacteroides abscessus subsp. abscessus]SHT56201.1 Extracellular phospholipase A1 precursor [Mycobacteroides abscessus subsp. abscessus]SHU34967.1 Extracellular phospholipase A1 precursor [Mycobacteroides abscessus subsp. abscessus]SHW81455.1 Extracellular phospholipase A1 precursor [Mycobacteroides abscessus subsp. abscessus]SIB71495.1 Extracellular phospholipase A1 precursor [Mycobacter
MTDTARPDGDDAPTQTLRASAPPPALELTGVGAGIVGAALTALGVWGLHVLTRGDGVAASAGWVILLCLAFTAVGKGITLLRRALSPLAAVWSATVSGVPPLLRAVAGIIVGSAGIWWVMRGHASLWWAQITGTDSSSMAVWSLPSQLVLVAIVAVAGALLFGGVKLLGKLIFANSGTREHHSPNSDPRDKWALWWSSHSGLGLLLLAGAATLIFLSGYVVPRVSSWLSGDDPMAALAAITAVLALALLANTWWWRALSGWWTWAHTPTHPGGPTPIGQIYAGAGVLALIAFSATAFGMATFASYLPQTAAVATADPCGDRCGGGGNGQGSYGPDTGNFQPPQMPGQQPDYQGGINQPPLDQNSGISIYNETPGQGGQAPQQNMGPQMPGQRAAHGEPLPNYGPWQPDAQPPAQAPVQQAPQPVQQAPAQQPVQQAPQAQAPQQPAQAPQPIQQQAPAPEQMPAEQPVQQAPPQQPPAQQPQDTPGMPQKDNSPIDPTDLAVAATRRGAQQAGEQGATQAAQQVASQGLPKPPAPTSWSGQITNAPDPAIPNSNNALTMAQMVQHVYDPSQALPPGWSQIGSTQVEQLTGINPDTVASGLHVGVFTDGNGHYVSAFAGAQNQIDQAVVVVEETGGNPAQYQDAVQVVAGLVQHFGAENVAATGHSMGGGEAAAGALQNGTSAITFEAQGLSPGYLQSAGINPDAAFAQAANGQIQHYFTQGEFATLLQREIPFVNGLPNAPGLNYALPWVDEAGNVSAVGPPGDAHNIAVVIKGLIQTEIPPQLMFTQPIPGEALAEGVVNTFGPIFVEPIAGAVLGGMSTPPPAP